MKFATAALSGATLASGLVASTAFLGPSLVGQAVRFEGGVVGRRSRSARCSTPMMALKDLARKVRKGRDKMGGGRPILAVGLACILGHETLVDGHGWFTHYSIYSATAVVLCVLPLCFVM